MSISMIVVFLFLQENDGEVIRKRTKRSLANNRRTIARDTRGPDEITQKDLDNVTDYLTGKVYNQVTVCVLARADAYWSSLHVRRMRTKYTLPYKFISFYLLLLQVELCIKNFKSQ